MKYLGSGLDAESCRCAQYSVWLYGCTLFRSCCPELCHSKWAQGKQFDPTLASSLAFHVPLSSARMHLDILHNFTSSERQQPSEISVLRKIRGSVAQQQYIIVLYNIVFIYIVSVVVEVCCWGYCRTSTGSQDYASAQQVLETRSIRNSTA